MRFAKSVRFAISVATWVLTSTSLPAAQTNVAVAANFTEAAKEIAAAFKAKTGHEAVLSFGSTGQFYTQITQGAPFQILLSADDARPKKLVDDGLAVVDSRFTYAIGKLDRAAVRYVELTACWRRRYRRCLDAIRYTIAIVCCVLWRMSIVSSNLSPSTP